MTSRPWTAPAARLRDRAVASGHRGPQRRRVHPCLARPAPLITRLRTLSIPAVLPATIPFTATTSSKLYATLDEHTDFSYLINIGYTSDCHGTGACRWGEIVGGSEPDMPTVFDYPKGRYVRLHNGALALFYPFSCGDSALEDQRAGFVYMVTRKAGSLIDLLTMANSAAHHGQFRRHRQLGASSSADATLSGTKRLSQGGWCRMHAVL